METFGLIGFRTKDDVTLEDEQDVILLGPANVYMVLEGLDPSGFPGSTDVEVEVFSTKALAIPFATLRATLRATVSDELVTFCVS